VISNDLARALDPARIAIDAGITPDEWQADLLRSDADRVLMLCSRQAGKTTTAAFMSLHDAIYKRPGGLVIIVSPSQRQSGEIFRTVMRHHSNLENVPEMRQESQLRAEMANGSRILALPGSETTVRGYSAASLIVIDEASRVEDSLLQAVRPMLATSQGRLVALTTPAGKRGWFFEAWTGDGNWHRVRVPASMCPRISKEFLAEELKELGASRFAEEYNLEFIDPDTAAFPTDIISKCFTDSVKPLWG
jgi:Terminase large subunit, T4likevirus-type, N-terminal